MAQATTKDLTTLPVGRLGLIPLISCKDLGEKVNEWLIQWRKERSHEELDSFAFEGYQRESYLIPVQTARFGSGEAKCTIMESVRGDDIYLMVDVCNYSLTYSIGPYENLMSPDDHFQDLKRVIGAIGGFVLGVTGFVYQTVFRNPLASPDIIGASSGASVGAAFGILFLPGAVAITLSAFAGAICCVLLALTLSSLTAEKDGKSIVLSGIAVHSLAQTALVCLKLLADPEKQLASIEYWIMGSLNGISLYSIGGNIALCLICLVGMFLLYRQILLLSLDDQEGRLLGVNVTQIRLIVLLIATLAASSVISMTGLISFISLLAPHGARLLFKNNRLSTMLFSGLLGGCLLTLGDIFARSIASTELPVSIFTSLLGAPFLIYLCIRRKPLQ